MTIFLRPLLLTLAVAAAAAGTVWAQGADVAFGGLTADTSLPVEVTADQLSVSQTDGTATFLGNVIVVQGDMRLAADRVEVAYRSDDRARIERLHASGHVILVSGPDAAEAADAVYTIDSGAVEMTGDVVLTQGANTIQGQKLVVDLVNGTGRMEGRVKTVLQPGGN